MQSFRTVSADDKKVLSFIITSRRCSSKHPGPIFVRAYATSRFVHRNNSWPTNRRSPFSEINIQADCGHSTHTILPPRGASLLIESARKRSNVRGLRYRFRPPSPTHAPHPYPVIAQYADVRLSLIKSSAQCDVAVVRSRTKMAEARDSACRRRSRFV
jgi:hypothetical protein